MKLVALKGMRYAGRALVAGDEFEASDKDANLLRRIKKARDATTAPSARPPTLPNIPEAAPAGRGVPRYARRDMRAEDKD